MNPLDIIDRYYKDLPQARAFLLEHSRAVAQKAVAIGLRVPQTNPDIKFIEESAMLHDIGIFLTNAPRLGCKGGRPYICHGVLGREILEREGLQRHAVVCETHVGVGLTKEDILNKGFPIPSRDMLPTTIEEIIVCFADKFFSKDDEPLKEKPLPVVRRIILAYGTDKLVTFDKWCNLFGYETGTD